MISSKATGQDRSRYTATNFPCVFLTIQRPFSPSQSRRTLGREFPGETYRSRASVDGGPPVAFDFRTRLVRLTLTPNRPTRVPTRMAARHVVSKTAPLSSSFFSLDVNLYSSSSRPLRAISLTGNTSSLARSSTACSRYARSKMSQRGLTTDQSSL